MKKILPILITIISVHLNTIKGQIISFTVTTTAPTCSFCCDGSFSVTMSGCTGYMITTIGLGAPTSFSTGIAVYSNVCTGIYTVQVVGNAPCGSATQICTITSLPTSIVKNMLNEKNLTIYPNPFYDDLKTTIEGDKIIEITDINGKTILDIRTEKEIISLKELPNSIYFVSIYNNKKALIHKQKIIKAQ